jgi:aryl carrier-like protein
VAQGYAGRPDLTERSFVPDPFSDTPGARMYRTGDLGRKAPDGTLMFIGRADDQVKIRGFRIEPKEVEQAILALRAIRDVAVVADSGDAGGKRLSAHVVLAPEESCTPEEIRAQLRSRLPDYMIPARIRCTAALPRTTSGKIDRNALRDAPDPRPQTAPPVPAPVPTTPEPGGLTGDRKVLAEVWAEVLGVESVGPDDDFFALGGDSIRAIRAIALAESRGVGMSLADLFDCPTIDGVCPPVPEDSPASTHPAEAPGMAPESDLPEQPPLPAGTVEAYPATLLQLGLIFEAAEQPSLYHDVVSHRIEARYDREALESALRSVAARHPVLRTRFDLGSADRPMQLVEREPRIPLTVRDMREADPGTREQTVDAQIHDAGLPFDVEAGPLLRVYVARLDDTEFQLTYGFHHAIMDGWSESVFLTELISAYESCLSGGTPDPAPQPTTGFREFVRLEDDVLRSPQSRDFWLRRCKDLGTAPGQVRSRSAERHRVSRTLPADLRGALEERGRQLRVPFKSLLVAAHLAALGRLTGSDAPVTGLAVNGRPETQDADRLVGLFLNIVPVTVDLGTASWGDLVQQAARAERELLPHRRYPYPALRDLAGGPLFSTVFNYVHFHLQSELTGQRAVRVRESRLFDKASHPLMVDLAQDPADGTLTVYATGDTALWDPRSLEDVCERHHLMLRSLADDPTAVPALG